MLPFLVLLFASSALAGPALIKQVPASDPTFIDNSLVGRALAIFESGDVNYNELNIAEVLKDLSRNGENQGRTNGQAIAVLGEVSTGRPGDACAAANYINAYTRYVETGNLAGVPEALANYIRVVSNGIDNIVGLVSNKDSVRFKTGSRGGCPDEGRKYQFDAAWDIILGSASRSQQSLINEEFCVAKRLYCGFNAISNNVGAQITASGLPPSVQVFELASGALADFLSRLGAGKNVIQSAANLKAVLGASVAKVSF